MHYLSSSINNDPAYHVDGGIMQAPVSDREVCAKDKPYCDYLSLAEEMVKKGRGHEIMPDEFCKKAGFGGVEMKMTAYRLWSLMGVGSVILYQLFFVHQICKAKLLCSGDDDYFSADIPLEPTQPYVHSLSTSFGALTAPALALFSEKDAEWIVARPEDLLPKWADAANGKLEWRIIKGASHDVNEKEAQAVLCEDVLSWLRKFE